MKQYMMNWLFNRAGFKSYRIRTAHSRKVVVDLIGPPGIGKSHLIRLLIEGGVIYKKASKFTPVYVASAERSTLLSTQCNNVEDLHSLQRKAGKLHYDLNVSLSDDSYLVDEGISHHFAKGLIDFSKQDPEGFYKLCDGRAIINLVANPQLVTSRILQRAAHRNNILPYHQGKSEKELDDFNEQLLQQRSELCERYRKFEVPVLNLDMGDAGSDRVKDIEIFLMSL